MSFDCNSYIRRENCERFRFLSCNWSAFVFRLQYHEFGPCIDCFFRARRSPPSKSEGAYTKSLDVVSMVSNVECCQAPF